MGTTAIYPLTIFSDVLFYREDTSAHLVLQDLQEIPTTLVIIWVTAIQVMPEATHAVNMLGVFGFKVGEITSVRYFIVIYFLRTWFSRFSQ